MVLIVPSVSCISCAPCQSWLGLFVLKIYARKLFVASWRLLPIGCKLSFATAAVATEQNGTDPFRMKCNMHAQCTALSFFLPAEECPRSDDPVSTNQRPFSIRVVVGHAYRAMQVSSMSSKPRILLSILGDTMQFDWDATSVELEQALIGVGGIRTATVIREETSGSPYDPTPGVLDGYTYTIAITGWNQFSSNGMHSHDGRPAFNEQTFSCDVSQTDSRVLFRSVSSANSG